MKNISLTSSPLACVVLAAGQGTRMRSDLPKVMHTVAGLPMIAHVINACAALQPDKIVVVIGKNMPTVQEVVAPHSCVIQPDPLGTADAVKAARDALKNFKGDILVLFGDTPLVTAEALKGLREKRAATGAVIVVAGFLPENPSAYGRLVLDNAGHLTAIVEAKEATPEQRAIDLCNSGLMLFEAEKLWPLLERVRSDNAKNEYYLTDCIKLARQEGWDCVVADMSAEDVMGINTRVELAEAERLMQQRLRRQAMLGGVTMIDPSTVYLSADTVLGRDVAIGPNVFIGSGVSISDRAEIRPFCHLEKTHVGVGAIVGPFARLRPGALIGDGVHIGNFVEIKNAEISAGAKINHLSYVGDAFVGEKANIGAGTITCNYDGFRKTKTQIGAGAFIGSNSALIAPVNVGAGAYVAAGSVVSMDVPPDALGVARAYQSNITDWAKHYRELQARKNGE